MSLGLLFPTAIMEPLKIIIFTIMIIIVGVIFFSSSPSSSTCCCCCCRCSPSPFSSSPPFPSPSGHITIGYSNRKCAKVLNFGGEVQRTKNAGKKFGSWLNLYSPNPQQSHNFFPPKTTGSLWWGFFFGATTNGNPCLVKHTQLRSSGKSTQNKKSFSCRLNFFIHPYFLH